MMHEKARARFMAGEDFEAPFTGPVGTRTGQPTGYSTHPAGGDQVEDVLVWYTSTPDASGDPCGTRKETVATRPAKGLVGFVGLDEPVVLSASAAGYPASCGPRTTVRIRVERSGSLWGIDPIGESTGVAAATAPCPKWCTPAAWAEAQRLLARATAP